MNNEYDKCHRHSRVRLLGKFQNSSWRTEGIRLYKITKERIGVTLLLTAETLATQRWSVML